MKSILLLAIFTAIIVTSWIGFGIFHNITTSTVAPDLQIKIDPIQSSFDLETIGELKRRKTIEVNLIAEPNIISQGSSQSLPIATDSADIFTNTVSDEEASQSPELNNQL